MQRAGRFSPRKLPPLPVKTAKRGETENDDEEEDEKEGREEDDEEENDDEDGEEEKDDEEKDENEEDDEEENEEEDEKEGESTPFETSLPLDVRCLVYQHLPASTLLELREHKLFPEVKKCVREIILDTPEITPKFLLQFPHLKKVSGPYPPDDAKSAHRDFAYVSKIENWASLITKNILFDHVAFEWALPEGISAEDEARHAEKSLERARLLKLLVPPFNFAFWHVLGTAGGNEKAPLSGIFDGGALSLIGNRYIPITLRALAENAKISRIWIDAGELVRLSRPKPVDSTSWTEKLFKLTKLPAVTEFGASRHVLKDAQARAPGLVSFARIRAGYTAKKYPLYIDEDHRK